MSETIDLFTAQQCLMNNWLTKFQLKECLKLLAMQPNRRLDQILFEKKYLSNEQIDILRQLWQKENYMTILTCPVCLTKHEVVNYQEDRLYCCSKCRHTLPPYLSSNTQNPKRAPQKNPTPDGLSLIPSQFGSYQILSELGRGGMGVVYKVKHPELEFPLALKILLPSQDEADREENTMRFFREIELASQLHHPNIISIHEVGSYNGFPYYTMDYIDGQTLDRLLDEQITFTEKKALEIMEKIAQGVASAHRAQIIHRDIKPANIILDKNQRPYLMDFGIATCRDQIFKRLTRTGTIMGTPEYMSPEQASGKIHEITFASDVYSLGATLYHMVTGQPPYDGTSPIDIISKVIEGRMTPIQDLMPKLSRHTEAVISKAMSFYVEDRYANAAIFALELRSLLAGTKTIAQPASLWNTKYLFMKHNLLIVLCFFVTGLAMVFAIIFLMMALK